MAGFWEKDKTLQSPTLDGDPDSFGEAFPPRITMGEGKAAATGKTTVSGAAKAAGSGLASGLSYAAGVFGDIPELGNVVSNWIMKKTGLQRDMSPEDRAKLEAYKASQNFMPGSQDIRDFAHSITGKELYRGNTPIERGLFKGSEFLGAATTGGGTGMARGTSLGLSQLVAPSMASGFGSEYGGQAAEFLGKEVVDPVTGQQGWGETLKPVGEIAGAIAAPLAGPVIKKAVQPGTPKPQLQQFVDDLNAEGIDTLTAGQITDKKGMRYAESSLGGNKTEAIYEKQREQLTRAALRRIGEGNEDRILPHVLQRARTRMGNEFDRLRDAYDGTMTQDAVNEITRIWDNYRVAAHGAPGEQTLQTWIEKLAEITRHPPGLRNLIAGPAAKKFHTDIGKVIHRNYSTQTGDRDLAIALDQLQDVVDDAVELTIQQSGNAADLGAWQRLRSEYRDLLVLEDAASRSGMARGLLTPAALRNSTQTIYGDRSYVQGRTSFDRLARAAEAMMTDMPQSGTSPRNRALTAVGSTVGGSALGQMFLGDPVLGALYGVGTAVAPSIAGSLMMSKPGQAWLGGNSAVQRGLSPLLSADPRTTGVLNAIQEERARGIY